MYSGHNLLALKDFQHTHNLTLLLVNHPGYMPNPSERNSCNPSEADLEAVGAWDVDVETVECLSPSCHVVTVTGVLFYSWPMHAAAFRARVLARVLINFQLSHEIR